MSSFPRDLLRSLPPLHRYSQKPPEAVAETEEGKEKEAGEGIELSLGLSLNGRFGVDPRTARKSLGRSSSIPDFLSQPPPEMEFSPSLIRTCSLPAETEDECRKRKDIQNLRRLEAKRKRSQKQSACSIHGNPAEEGQGLGGIHLRRRPLSQQGSLGSHGSGTDSSGVSSESDIQQQFHAAESEPASQALRGPPVANGSIPSDNQGLASCGGVGTTRNVLEEMPLVFTEGDGPDGKRVEGFLYRYRKGEEVRIVCVCHGSFFSPTEFVKHAGGDDVEHPMKQIVVLPSSLL